MDFEIPERVLPVLVAMREFVERKLYPIELGLLSAAPSGDEPELRALRDEVRARGLWAPQAPRELGGMGLSLLEHGMVSEVLGKSPLGHFVFGCQAPDAGNIEVLHAHGSAAQKQRFLAPLVRGDVRSCFAMTEPDTPGSNPTQLACMARLEGDHYVINGRKWFTSSAEGAAFAIVMAVTNPDAPPHGRASQILVPTDTPGYERVRNVPVMGHAGRGYFSHAEVRFRDCRVPVENRLGPPGSGFAIAQERLGPGRIHHTMRWIGICERAFDLMCARALGRQIDERGPLAQKQLIQAWIAESRAAIDAARLAVLRTAWLIDARGFAAAQVEVSLIKFHVAKVMLEVVDRAIQVHGALGITDDTVLAFFYTQERAARIYDGPDEVHKLAAARRILGGRSGGAS
jgi:alkylation response protein AidB-like acyl-CoA dehydrogenase